MLPLLPAIRRADRGVFVIPGPMLADVGPRLAEGSGCHVLTYGFCKLKNGSSVVWTETEYARLLNKVGFRLSRIVATQSPVSVVEAVRA
jgi:hypothetical protein